MKLLKILLLFSSIVFAQQSIPTYRTTLLADDIDLGTYVQSATPDTNTVELNVNRKYSILNSVSSSDSNNLYFPDNLEMLSNEDRFLNGQGDLLSGWDFTSGWYIITGSADDNNSFTTTGAGGARITTYILESGKTYYINVQGNTTASTCDVYYYYVGSSGKIRDGLGVATFTPTEDARLYLRNSTAGTTDISLMEVYKIPSNWQLTGEAILTENDDTTATYHALDGSNGSVSIGLNGLVENQYYDFTFGWQKDSLDASPIITINNISYTLNANSSTRQDTVLSFAALGGNSDTITVSFSDTCKAKIDNSLKIDYDKVVVTKDSTKSIAFIVDINTVGNFSETITTDNTATNSNEAVTVTWSVIASNDLFVNDMNQDIDTVDFGTVSNVTTEALLVLENKTDVAKTINWYKSTSGLSFWGSNWIISQPSSYPIILSIPANTKDSMYVRFNPLVDGVYQDTLLISSTFSSSVDTIIFKGTASGINSPSLLAMTLTIPDTSDKMSLVWTDAGDEQYYDVYRKYSGGSFSKIATVTTQSYEDDVNYLTDVSYYIQAINSEGNSLSDTVTKQQAPLGTYYTLATSGGTYSTIASVNTSHPAGTTLLIKSGQQFSDAILNCKTNSTYATYGGEAMAILGDSSKGSSGFYRTIDIDNAGVNLKHLKLYSNGEVRSTDNSLKYTMIIKYTVGGWTLKHCELIGGSWGRKAWFVGIGSKETTLTAPIKILNNEIHDMNIGIYSSNNYNVEIAYNEMYNFYRLDGSMDHGGHAIRMGGTYNGDTFDAEYTTNIHHNEIYNFEYVALAVGHKNLIIEYNNIHSNLDERIYRGGVKHGSIGKIYDNTGVTEGGVGIVFRYNYVHDLVRRGVANYTYGQQSEAGVLAGTFTTVSTNNGYGRAVYEYSVINNENGYGDHYGDASGESPDNVISGLGYAHTFVHNNIFENCSNKLFGRSTNSSYGLTDYRSDLGSFLVNNTIINCGYLDYITNDALSVYEYVNYSDHWMVNNIIDFTNSLAYATYYIKGTNSTSYGKVYFDNNIYLNQDGLVTASPSNGDGVAVWIRDGKTNQLSGASEQYLTDPQWIDSSQTFFASNIGVSGTYLPNVQIYEGGNSNGTGYSYTSINGGVDGEGRSFAYDILGNYRLTNDIGALGVESETYVNITPVITQQPTDVSDTLGATISYNLLATLEEGTLGYQWWKLPEGVIVEDGDSSKYEGATSNTLTIKTITTSDAMSTYLCEVKNLNGWPSSGYWVNSNEVSLGITSESLPGADIDTLVIAQGSDDMYTYGAYLNTTADYIKSGLDGADRFTCGMILTGMNDWTRIDSAKMIFVCRNNRTGTWDYNLRYEASSNPTTFSSYADFASRTYIAENDDGIITTDWTDNVAYTIDCTTGIQALNSDYTYGSTDIGKINTTVFGTDATTARAWDSYEGNVKAIIIIYGTK